ncbi:MAG: LysR family transcriptional regulator [Flavobacteriales bacterium]|jgi:Transcriptional regulator|uniref:hydrogen peroxide-inducible genes activator n=1 Tax=Candidatus Kaistella beijingensis TaxID=2820270 RepID=UPI001A1057FB|nr:hydrogen peroxide-inducible genes activator [Candidatus Kaistella beijingensis]MBE2272800.1 LysR family transcriptional regulator [Flavobacteriales bacterium]MCA0391364.1 LysR family transcriptional regulator [Bacteroidota bacterium]HOB23696.1 LysR substrate-binding domain-containing protein [Kaistella sp.]MBN8622470.1 LysR family transcriptional regulator [Flavobacteriales bacterium]UBB89216.1 LysR family transcriptional regulator [Candidatus Kaistella beijingensis]
MNIQQLEYLIAVDKYKHFGNAAQACFITQPTLSAMIQKFEDELDVKIFDRTTHPIRTTDVGSQIIVEAKKVIDTINELKNKASLLNNVLAGKLNLGIIPTVSGFILPVEIFEFLKLNPKIELHVKEMTTDNIIKALKSGELDAGIISTPYSAANEFYSDFLFNEELMIYSADENESEKDSYVVPEEIDVQKVWLLEEGNCLRTQFENICQLRENTMKPKNLEFLASNISTLVQMVDKLGGISILPELAIEQLAENQKKMVKRFRKPFPYREISVIYYKPTYKQKILDELIAFIKESLSKKLNYNKDPENFVGIKPQ